MLYGIAMQKVVEKNGGKFLFSSPVQQLVIGEVETLWDIVAMVEYPSAAAFAKIRDLAGSGRDRRPPRAGLEGQLLIRVSPNMR